MQVIHFSPETELGKKLGSHVSDIWQATLKSPTEQELQMFGPVLAETENLLQDWAFDTSSVRVVLGTGCETSNGHALLDGRSPVVWISLSNYPTVQTARVFFLHELLHGLHYEKVSEYAFQSREQKNHVGRQLVTEGLATYLTHKIFECTEAEALWADYLPEDQLRLVMTRYLDNYSASLHNIHLDWESTDKAYFYANDSNDVDTYRSGYYVGLKIFQMIERDLQIKPTDLISMPREELDKIVFNYFSTKT